MSSRFCSCTEYSSCLAVFVDMAEDESRSSSEHGSSDDDGSTSLTEWDSFFEDGSSSSSAEDSSQVEGSSSLTHMYLQRLAHLVGTEPTMKTRATFMVFLFSMEVKR